MKEFSFGFYKNKNVIDLWTGSAINDESIIHNYIKDLIKIIEHKGQAPFWFPLGTIKPNIKDFYETKKVDTVEIGPVKLISENGQITIASDNTRDINLMRSNIKLFLESNYLDFFINYSNATKAYDKNKLYTTTPNVTTFIKSLANPNYILWALKETENFYINHETISVLNSSESKMLTTFKIDDISKGVLSYKPIFVNKQMTVSDELIKISKVKEENYKDYVRFQIESENEHFGESHENYETWSDGSCMCCDQSPCICYD